MAIDRVHAGQERMIRSDVGVLGACRYREDVSAGEFSDVDHGRGDDTAEDLRLLRLHSRQMTEHGQDFDQFPAPAGFPALGSLTVEFTGYFAGVRSLRYASQLSSTLRPPVE